MTCSLVFMNLWCIIRGYCYIIEFACTLSLILQTKNNEKRNGGNRKENKSIGGFFFRLTFTIHRSCTFTHFQCPITTTMFWVRYGLWWKDYEGEFEPCTIAIHLSRKSIRLARLGSLGMSDLVCRNDHREKAGNIQR